MASERAGFVDMPQEISCGGCGAKIIPPYRGKPAMLLATRLVVFCNRKCKDETTTEAPYHATRSS